MSNEEIINIMKYKIEEIVKEQIKESMITNSSKDRKVISEKILMELDKVMSNEAN